MDDQDEDYSMEKPCFCKNFATCLGSFSLAFSVTAMYTGLVMRGPSIRAPITLPFLSYISVTLYFPI